MWNWVYHQKLVKKLVWIPVISFCKSFILSYVFDGMLCQNWPFSPPSRLTLRITLLLTTYFKHQNSIYQSSLSHELDRIDQLGCSFASDQFCGGFYRSVVACSIIACNIMLPGCCCSDFGYLPCHWLGEKPKILRWSLLLYRMQTWLFQRVVVAGSNLLTTASVITGSQVGLSIPQSTTLQLWSQQFPQMLWDHVFCQSKRSVTGCREQEDLVLSQKKVQSAADMLWVAFIEFYWAWYAQELQVTTISASLFTSLRAWCGGVLLLLLFQPPNILDINYLLLVWFFFLLLFSKL